MRFQINEIRVKSKTPCPDQFSWLQRLAIKWLKIPVTIKYNYEYTITIFKSNYLKPGMTVFLNHLMNCRVISNDPNNSYTHVMVASRPLTYMESIYLCSSKEGALLGSQMPEGSNFKRQCYV